MNSIQTGKQENNLSWYQRNKQDKILSFETTKPSYDTTPTLISQIPLNGIDLLPSLLKQSVEESRSLRASAIITPATNLPPVPTDSIPLCHHQSEFSETGTPLEHRSRTSPREVIKDDHSHHGIKHSHDELNNVNFFSTPDAIPMKKQRMSAKQDLYSKKEQSSASISSYDPTDLGNDFRDFNVVSGTDLVDFWFSIRVPSDIIVLEEAERKDRMEKGIDGVKAGKWSALQKEFMEKVAASQVVSTFQQLRQNSYIPVGRAFSSLKHSAKDKTSELLESAKETLNTTPLHRSLNIIAEESKYKGVESEPSDRIEFKWPREVPQEISSAEEVARLERMERKADAVISGKFARVHSELRSKWISEMSYKERVLEIIGTSLRSLEAVEEVGKSFANISISAAEAAVERATSMLHFGKDLSTLASIHREEEIERSRRLANSEVDPLLAARKMRIERELLSSVKRI